MRPENWPRTVTSRARTRASTRAPAAIVRAKPGMSMVPLTVPSTTRSSDAATSPAIVKVRGSMAVAIGELLLTADTLTAANYATTRRRDHDESRGRGAASVSAAASARASHAATSASMASRTIAALATSRASDGARPVGSSGHSALRAASRRSRRTPTAPRRARRRRRVCGDGAPRRCRADERDPRRDERPGGERRRTACAAVHDRASAPATPARPRAARRRRRDGAASAASDSRGASTRLAN